MNKYIDAEELKAELRRQRRELELSIKSQGDCGQSCQIIAYENILSFITSLQQEQPEVDLEEEIKDMYSRDTATLKTREQYAKLARHFWNKGYNARKLEQL